MDKLIQLFKNRYIYTIITLILFSLFELLSKFIALDGQDSIQTNAFRFLLGALVLFVYLVYKKNLKPTKKEFLLSLLIGVTYVTFGTSFTQIGLSAKNVSLGLMLIICSTPPILITMLSSLVERKKFKLHEKIGLVIGFIGVIISFSDKLNSLGVAFMPYLILIVGNMFFVAYVVAVNYIPADLDIYKINAYSFLFGLIGIFSFMYSNNPHINYLYLLDFKMIILGVFVTGITVFTLFLGIKNLGMAKNQSILLLKPFLASALIWIFTGEQISIPMFCGTSVLVLGVLILINGKPFNFFAIHPNKST